LGYLNHSLGNVENAETWYQNAIKVLLLKKNKNKNKNKNKKKNKKKK